MIPPFNRGRPSTKILAPKSLFTDPEGVGAMLKFEKNKTKQTIMQKKDLLP